MAVHSDRIGTTERELRCACVNLQYVRDDVPIPPTLRPEAP